MVRDEYTRYMHSLWTDRCTIYVRRKAVDGSSHLTDFSETVLFEDEPCRLSFSSISAADGSPVAATAQSVKLFISSELDIPAGCKIVVRRADRELVFEGSGVPAIYSAHQEIPLKLWKEWA